MNWSALCKYRRRGRKIREKKKLTREDDEPASLTRGRLDFLRVNKEKPEKKIPSFLSNHFDNRTKSVYAARIEKRVQFDCAMNRIKRKKGGVHAGGGIWSIATGAARNQSNAALLSRVLQPNRSTFQEAR